MCAQVRHAAEQGHAGAQCGLGGIFSTSRGEREWGVRQDDGEAAKWFAKAAAQGDANAQYNLAMLYHQGLGVRQDDAEAVKWLRLGAAQGFARSQHSLGACFANGEGVPHDLTEAVKWFRLAAAQGDAQAQATLAQGLARGVGGTGVAAEDTAEAKRLHRLAKAPQQGGGAPVRLACQGCKLPFPLAALRKCSQCNVARYCGKECQKAHWKAHKKACREAAASQAGAR
jgi:TPR repeat protein